MIYFKFLNFNFPLIYLLLLASNIQHPASKLTFLSQISHFYSDNSDFCTFVSVFSTTSVDGLLYCIIGKNTENHRNVVFYVELFDSMRYTVANKVKTFGFSLNNSSDS